MKGDKSSDTRIMEGTGKTPPYDIQRAMSEEQKKSGKSKGFDLPIQTKRTREKVPSSSESESEVISKNLEQGKRRKTQDSGVVQSSDDLWKRAKTFIESQEKGEQAFQSLEFTEKKGHLSPKLKSQWEDFARETQDSPNFKVNFRNFTKHVARFAENAHQVNKTFTEMDTLFTDASKTPNQQEQLERKFSEMQKHYDTWYVSDVSIEAFHQYAKIPLLSTTNELKDIGKMKGTILSKRENSNYRSISADIHSFSNEKSRENFETLRKAWDSLSPLHLPDQRASASVSSSSDNLWNNRRAFIQDVGNHYDNYQAYKSFTSLKSMKEAGHLSLELKSQWEDFAREAHTNQLYQERLGRFTTDLLETAKKENQINAIFNDMESLFTQSTKHLEPSEQLNSKYKDMKNCYNAWENSIGNIEKTQRIAKDPKIASQQNLRMNVGNEVSQKFEDLTEAFSNARNSFSAKMNKENFKELQKQWEAIRSPDWSDQSD